MAWQTRNLLRCRSQMPAAAWARLMIEFSATSMATFTPQIRPSRVDDFILRHGNTSTTLLTDRCLDERAALDNRGTSLVARELAHQWFGDLVVIKHWSHA